MDSLGGRLGAVGVLTGGLWGLSRDLGSRAVAERALREGGQVCSQGGSPETNRAGRWGPRGRRPGSPRPPRRSRLGVRRNPSGAPSRRGPGRMREPCGVLEQPAGSGPLRAAGRGRPRGVEPVRWGREAEPPGRSSGESGPRGPQISRKSGAAGARSPEAPGARSLHPREPRGMWDCAQLPVFLCLFPDLFEHRLQF